MPSKATPRQRLLVLGVTLLAAFTLTLATLTWVDRPREADLSDLIAALPNPRPYAARLSGGFPYAPCERPAAGEYEIPKLVCAAAPTTREQQARLNALRDDFFRYAGHQPEARRRHLDALWTLTVEGTRGNLDRAIADLEAASKLEPESGAILSDLAAAFTARAAKTDDARDLVRALDAAERAAQASPEVPEALWNRAVAREVFVRRPALGAWEEILEAAPDLQWSEEARAAVERLDQPTVRARWEQERRLLSEALGRGNHERAGQIVATFPGEARSWVEADLLAGWAAAVKRGDLATAARLLTQATAVSEHLAEIAGDSLFLRGARVAEEALHRGGSSVALASLAHGHQAWSEGLAAFDRAEYDRAAIAFLAARADLSRGGSPLGAWAHYLALRCAHRAGDYERVLAEAGALAVEAERLGSPALASRVRVLLGSAQAPFGLTSAVLSSYRLALAEIEHTGEALRRAAFYARLGSGEAVAGQASEAWAHRVQALAAIRGYEDDREFGAVLAEGIYGAVELKALHAALALQAEELRAARASGDSLALMLALRHQSQLLAKLDDHAAHEALTSSRQVARELPDLGQRRLTLHQIDLVEAHLFRAREPARSVELLREVVPFFQHSVPGLVPEALHERALAELRLGHLEAAEADLGGALEAAESLRLLRTRMSERAALIESLASIHEERISLALRKGDAEGALEVVERSRARALLDWLHRPNLRPAGEPFPGTEGLQPRPVHELLPDLPADRVFLLYHLRDTELLAWVVRPTGVELVRTEVAREELRALVAALDRSRQDPPQSELGLARLFDLAIRPVLPKLRAGELLHVIPSDALSSIPFAALLNRSTGQYLIESHPLAFAPSLNGYLELARRQRPRPDLLSSVLVVADPAFDTTLFPGLPRLPAARREMQQISQQLQAATLEGSEATKAAFLSAVSRKSLVHVSAHALVSAPDPLDSRLLLAPEADGTDYGVVYGSDLLAADLSQARLIILAACQSAGIPSSEGTAGLVWPLLARGVPQVLATVSTIQDSPASSLMNLFYRDLEGTGDPSLALRRAQLQSILISGNEAREALQWGAFQLFGLAEATQ